MPSKVINFTDTYTNTLINEVGARTDVTLSYEPMNRSRTWVNTPGYQSKVRNRKRGIVAQLPDNPLTEFNYFRSYGYGSFVWTQPNPAYVGKITGVLTPSIGWVPNMNDSRFSELYSKVLGKLPTKMNGSSFNVPLFLAEFHKTVDMVVNATKILSAAIDRYKKFSSKQRRDLLPFNKWLEYRYGWRLLVKDIYDALTTLFDMVNFGIRQKVSASAFTAGEASFIDTSNFNVIPWNNVFNYAGEMYVTRSERLDLKINLKYKETSPGLSSLQQLGITNPLSLLYELTAFSFILDWFIPIGDFLQGFDRFLGKEFVSGCISKSYETVVTTKLKTLRSRNYPTYSFSLKALTPCTVRIRYYTRTTLTSFPSTQLPSIQMNLNASRVTDAIAILLQRRKTVSGFKGNPVTI